MSLEISTSSDTTIIMLVRRFDANTAPSVEAELKGIIDKRPDSVLFDFTQTDYIASGGLRVLLSTTKQLMKTGSRIGLCSLSPQVRQVFDIAGFNRIFSIYGTRQEALAALQKK